LKIYEIYTSFNVSPMKAYKRPMYKWIHWLRWHKVLQKP
jgi:hypothetical protein